MGLLDKFERSMERLLEGTSGALFRQRLQPAEIGTRLERAMLDGQRASVGTRIVPNVFVVYLHPDDFVQFEGFTAGLCRQLEGYLGQVAARRNLTVLDRITVSLESDDQTAKRAPRVTAAISDRAAPRRRNPSPPVQRQTDPPAADHTSVYQVPRPSTRFEEGAAPHLLGLNGPLAGSAIVLRVGRSMVGRLSENDIVINEPDVSRIHARIERNGDHIRVFDLNSTNGTRINGEAIHISDVEPGDRIRFGGQEFELRAMRE